MGVGGIIPSSNPFQMSDVQQPNGEQRQTFTQDFQALQRALQSGDAQTAQSAYATLMQNLPNGGNGSGIRNNPFIAGLKKIGSALQAANLSQAQQVMASLQNHMGIHGHHRHGHGDGWSRSTPAAGSAGSVAQNTESISINFQVTEQVTSSTTIGTASTSSGTKSTTTLSISGSLDISA